MTSTPHAPDPDDTEGAESPPAAPPEDARGAEIGLSDGEGSTFEPEEDEEGPRLTGADNGSRWRPRLLIMDAWTPPTCSS
jgi:hypothetical protein